MKLARAPAEAAIGRIGQTLGLGDRRDRARHHHHRGRRHVAGGAGGVGQSRHRSARDHADRLRRRRSAARGRRRAGDFDPARRHSQAARQFLRARHADGAVAPRFRPHAGRCSSARSARARPTRAFAELRAAGEAALARDHPARDQLAQARFDFAADLRYRGQEHTIAIPVAGADDLTGDTEATRLKFNQQHDRRYGHAAPDQSIEIVNLRLTVTVPRMEDVIGALAVAAVDADRVRTRAAPAGHLRRSGDGRSRRASCGGPRWRQEPRSPGRR